MNKEGKGAEKTDESERELTRESEGRREGDGGNRGREEEKEMMS